MENKLIKLDTQELHVIEKSKAEKIRKTFEPMAKMLAEFEESYNLIVAEAKKEITKDITAQAKRLRLNIGKVRIETGKLKDKQKEYIKLEDKAIMGVHNILVWAVKEKEDKLKEIENYFEIQEKKRLEALQIERVEKLSKYLDDAHERNLTQMDEDVWTAYFGTKKREYEDRIAAEKKAELDRIAKEKADAEERKRIRIENERLKKEAEEREKAAKIEAKKRAEAEEKRRKIEEAEREVREEQARKERRIYEAKIKAEREEKERVQNELKAKQEAEIKVKEAEEKRIQGELNKGDSAKVKDLITDLKELKSKYVFKSVKNKQMYSSVILLLDKIINFIQK